MSDQTDFLSDAKRTPEEQRAYEERLNALPAEDKRRILMAMRFLLDATKLHLSAKELAADLLEGKAHTADLGMRLMDFERDLRFAANEIVKHPLRVVHADALRLGHTKVDDHAWEMRVRVRAHEARKAREQAAREAEMHKATAPQASQPEAVAGEPEDGGGPRP